MLKLNDPRKHEIHYKDCDMSMWRWEHFTPQEIACNGDGLLFIDEDAMDKLEAFRKSLGVAFSPNSAYRSAAYNAKVGGAPNSQHKLGKAFDIPIRYDMDRTAIHYHAKKAGFTGFGDYNTFVHIDTGRPRYWDNRK